MGKLIVLAAIGWLIYKGIKFFSKAEFIKYDDNRHTNRQRKADDVVDAEFTDINESE